MQINPKELTQLQRPKLLMSTAKYLVEKRKFKGETRKKINPQRVQKLLETEAKHENDRKEKRGVYQASQHVEVLAELIEYVYLSTNEIKTH